MSGGGFGLTALLVLGALLVGGWIVGALVSQEALGWVSVLCRYLVRRATEQLPEAKRERYREEWQAEYLTTRERPLTALIEALSFSLSARSLSREPKSRRDLRRSRLLLDGDPDQLAPPAKVFVSTGSGKTGTVLRLAEALESVDGRLDVVIVNPPFSPDR